MTSSWGVGNRPVVAGFPNKWPVTRLFCFVVTQIAKRCPLDIYPARKCRIDVQSMSIPGSLLFGKPEQPIDHTVIFFCDLRRRDITAPTLQSLALLRLTPLQDIETIDIVWIYFLWWQTKLTYSISGVGWLVLVGESDGESNVKSL